MKKINLPEPEIVCITGGISNGRDGMFSNHLSTVLKLHNGNYRPYLCRRYWFDDKTTSMDIGYCDVEDYTNWPNLSKNFRPLLMENLPVGCKTAHPCVIETSCGYEMFCWIHGNGMVRYVKCNSENGVDFKIENLSRPSLYHPGDVKVKEAKASGLLTFKEHKMPDSYIDDDDRSENSIKELISNDATSVYFDYTKRKYVMYTVSLLPSITMPERRVEHDNAPDWLRVIHRRTSSDGLEWSPSERAIVPDSTDPIDLQFYCLVAKQLSGLTFGLTGYYQVRDQIIDIEPMLEINGKIFRNKTCWSLRNRITLNGRPVKMLFPGAIIKDKDCLFISATACSYLHNQIGNLKPIEYVQGNVIFRIPIGQIYESTN